MVVEKHYIGRRLRRRGYSHANTEEVSSGAVTSASYKLRLTLPTSSKPTRSVRLKFGNGMAALVTAITVRASIVVNGNIYQCRWNGATSVVIQRGDEVITDSIDLSLFPGQEYFVIAYVEVPVLGNRWPTSSPTPNVESGDGVVNSTDATLTNTGFSTSGSYGYYPSGIIADCYEDSPAVAFFGDSIASGVGEASVYGYGFCVRAADTAGLAHIVSGLPGEKLQTFVTTTWDQRVRHTAGCGTAVIQYGINDVNDGRTLAQYKADLTTAVQRLAMVGFRRFIVCTLTPHDGLAAGEETVRQEINAWLRAGTILTEIPQVNAVADVAGAVEANSYGGAVAVGGAFWASGMNSESAGSRVHPDSDGHAAMAAVLAPVLSTYAVAYQDSDISGLRLGTTSAVTVGTSTYTQVFAGGGSIYIQSALRMEFEIVVSPSQPGDTTRGKRVSDRTDFATEIAFAQSPVWVRSKGGTDTLVVMTSAA